MPSFSIKLMRLNKCFTPFSLVILLLLFCLVLFSPFKAKLLNGNFQSQVSASETHTSAEIDHSEITIEEKTLLDVYNTTSYQFINVDDGNHVVWINAFDKAENINETYVSLKADSTPLNVSIIRPTARVITSANVTIVWSASDTVSGISYYEINLTRALNLNNVSWINLGNETSYSYTELNDGNYTVYVKAVDDVGNSAEASISFTVLTAPTTGALVDKWWFWLALAVTAALVVFAAFSMKRRNPSSGQTIKNDNGKVEISYLYSTKWRKRQAFSDPKSCNDYRAPLGIIFVIH